MARGRLKPGDVRADKRSDEFAGQGNQRQSQYGLRRQSQELRAQVQARGREEQRDKEAFRRASHAGHDVAAHLVGQHGEGRSKEQRSQGAVQPHAFGGDDHQEQAAQQQPEGELGHLQESVQMDYHPGQHPCGDEPGYEGEPDHLTYDGRYAQPVQRVAVSSCVEVLANGKSHHEQGDQLCDDHGGEDLNAHRLPDAPFVYKRLGDYAKAREGQDPGQSQSLGEFEAQLEVYEVVGGDRQGTPAAISSRTARMQ